MPTASTSLRTISGAMIALGLILIPAMAGAKTLTVPTTKYPTIQSAVNAANPGDTINVNRKSGGAVYSENVSITTNNLTINGIGNPVLDGGGINGSGDGFTVVATNVTVDGFTVQNFIANASNILEPPRAGFRILGDTDITVNGDTLSGDDYGVDSEDSLNTIVEFSTFTNDDYFGVVTVASEQFTCQGCTFTDNGNGPALGYAINDLGDDLVTLSDNEFSNNFNAIGIQTAANGPNPPGVPPANPTYVTGNYFNNTGDAVDVYNSYLVNINDNLLYNDYSGISLVQVCLQCTVSDNLATGTSYGTIAAIQLDVETTSCTVSQNLCVDNQCDGIIAYYSSGNTFSGNVAYGNTYEGSVDASDNSGATAATVQNTWKNNLFGVTSPTGLP